MMRDTTTGGVLENSILPSLKKGGYQFHTQKKIGERIGGKTYKMDCVAEIGGARLAFFALKAVKSLKIQKPPFAAL